VKKNYKNKYYGLSLLNHLGGLVDDKVAPLYEEITTKADIGGGLLQKNRPNDEKNWNYLFQIAKKLNKPVHVHIDQENNPNERDTGKLIAGR